MNEYMMDSVSHENDDDLNKLFVGRKISSVDFENMTIVLDDGTSVLVVPHEENGPNDGGEFFLTHLSSFDHVITSVKVVETWDPNGEDQRREIVELFVYTAGIPTQEGLVVKVEGDSGNGYYGSGFTLRITQ